MGSSLHDDGNHWHLALQQRKEEINEPLTADTAKNATETRRRRPRRSRFGNNDYVPPFRRKQLQGEREHSVQIQQAAWMDMKKKINGVINRLNASNIRDCVVDLLRLNLIRGKGLFCKALMRAQLASSHFSNVYAALISVLNTRIPEVGELLVCRLFSQLKEGSTRREKAICVASLRFLAHLFNQQVINELPLLEFTLTCLIDPSNGSTELAVLVIQECGHFMSEKSPQATEMVFTRLREVLHNNAIDYRTQVLVDDVMELRRKKFGSSETLRTDLDLVDEDDIIPHFFSLQDAETRDTKEELNSFTFDRNFDDNESKYSVIRDILLGSAAEPKQKGTDPKVGGSGELRTAKEDKSDEQETDHERRNPSEKSVPPAQTEDMTESKLVDFRRIVYLKIMSSASYEEVAHKLTKFMSSNRGMETELCNMIIECCSQEKTFLRYYGLLGQRLCFLSKNYVNGFQEKFETIYATVHRYDNRKIRNVATFFASLLSANALSWGVMRVVHLIEEETTASRRIFLKILFQEVAKTVGSSKLTDVFRDDETSKLLATVLPRDEPKNSRFAINFFTVIGLGFLTEDLREHLKHMPKAPSKELAVRNVDDGDESSSLSSSSLSSSSLSSSSGISECDDVPSRRTKETRERRERIGYRTPSQHSDDSGRAKSPARDRTTGRYGNSLSPRMSKHGEDREQRSPGPKSRGQYLDDVKARTRSHSPNPIAPMGESPRSFSSSYSSESSRSRQRGRSSDRHYRRESSSPEARRKSRSRDRPRRSGSYTRRRRSGSSSSSEPRRRYKSRSPSSSGSSRYTRKRKASPYPDDKEARKERKSGSSYRARRSSYSSDSGYASSERGRRSSRGYRRS